ncbi:unnamed protein product, partial [Durusdinium trenchii]
MDLPPWPPVEESRRQVMNEPQESAQKEEFASLRRRFARASEELEKLRSRHEKSPLDCSMQESLRVHFLTQLIERLSGELQGCEVEAEERKPDPEKPAAAPTSPSRGSAGVFLTSAEPDLLDDPIDDWEDSLDQAVAEHLEGDCFGASRGVLERFVVHEDAVLLVLHADQLRSATERCEAQRRAQRGEMLQRSLGDEEVAQRLLPLFRQERYHKGTVLVKAGAMPSSLWLIVSGQCSQVNEADSKD